MNKKLYPNLKDHYYSRVTILENNNFILQVFAWASQVKERKKAGLLFWVFPSFVPTFPNNN